MRGAPDPVFQSERSPLSEEHRQYLLKRHGTLDLDPIPQMDDDDPLNWSMPKVSSVATNPFHHKKTSG